MVGLLVVGLAAADIVTYTSVRSVLRGRIDEQLDTAQYQVYKYLAFATPRAVPVKKEGERLDEIVSPDVYVLVLNSRRQVVIKSPSGSQRHPDPQPALPARYRIAAAPRYDTFGSREGVFRPNPDSFLVTARSDPTALYRGSAVAIPGGRTLFTAVSLNSTSATLDSLMRYELGASAAVVLALCILALWAIRRGLRPLEDMAQTAGAIASGDLTRRVPAADQTTEVGRLGSALNTMLSKIEAAFTERTVAETRLRQFVADASHELRTPLTSIQGYTELLRKGAFTDEAGRRRALERVENEAVRMSALVDDLLLLANLDEGRALERAPASLDRVCAEAVEDALAVDPERPIRLEVAEPVVVIGDRDGLRQVAHNLVRNALVHTPPGTPIHVTAFAEGGRGVLSVRDEGPGLGSVDPARVFDRFYQGDVARTGSSSGLGLSIVRAIAEALDGTATASSVDGEGTDFRVSLPLAPPGTRVPPDRRRRARPGVRTAGPAPSGAAVATASVEPGAASEVTERR
jgi:two-component system OmpR family sensor kinase